MNTSIKLKSGRISLYGFACGYIDVTSKGEHDFTLGQGSPRGYYYVSHRVRSEFQGRKIFSHLTAARKYISSFKV